ncbi:60 kDa SS-A/Ro ribonucleoprotein-like [Xenia sp. Carnegie-2017]|uniref:60 kDa SS-A/Ro ribonucleoprotein-like n=1 Tax=Xenia sp. Carnegie-2017 TaxID=2897299 RepID=UPI001F04CD31|nr:60 kDa SS-A/Ro ribonucleoprotein-like [Xenia sp. Carnegie-2017]
MGILEEGNCSMNNGDYETAIEHYNNCVKVAGESSIKMMALFGLANAYTLSDKGEEAINCFNDCLNLSSELEIKYFQHQIYLGLGSIHCTTKRLEDGIKKYEMVCLCHVALGGLNKLLENYEKSLEHYKNGFPFIDCEHQEEEMQPRQRKENQQGNQQEQNKRRERLRRPRKVGGINAVEEVKTLQKEARMVELINQHNLVREHIPTHWLNSKEVWDALLKKMPMTAMIRNLSKMTSIGLLAEGSPQVKDVCDKLRDEDLLRNARIHPFNMLFSLKMYESGKGEKGSLEWKANVEITKALEKAFYLSFKNVEPTGKSCMLAMDVSGSMQSSGCIGASTIKPHVASAAMAMMTARTEKHHEFVAFSHEIVPMKISSNMNLDEVLNICNEIPEGKTDCAQPMLYAIDKNLKIDVFIVYTNSETHYGDVHPREALKQYRHHSGIHDAKLIVVAMTSSGFTIADPDDPGMLDIAGFDSAAPQMMREFILWNL